MQDKEINSIFAPINCIGQIMDIVACTDTNYVMPCGVMLYSVCKNNKDLAITFHIIIDQSIDEEQKESLKNIIIHFKHSKKSIVFYNIDGEKYQDLPRLDNSNPKNYITKAAYYILYIPELLPTDIDKVLYLDCDIIVRHSLENLWNIDLKNKSVAVVPDVAEGLIDKYNRLRYPQVNGYFNSGVVLISLKKWRHKKILSDFTSFINKHPDWIKLHDQDVLNRAFYDDKLILPIKYNFQEGFLWKEIFYDYWKYEKEVLEARKDPVIIHYTDSKPWKKGCDHPWKDVFFNYQKETEWADMPIIYDKPNISLINRTKNSIRKIFEKIGIMKPYSAYPSKYIEITKIS